jgi:hypothetical protein
MKMFGYVYDDKKETEEIIKLRKRNGETRTSLSHQFF